VPSSNGWTPMRIRSNGTHVNVSMLGVQQLTNVPCDLRASADADADGFASPRWRFAFGSRATGAEPHKISQMRMLSAGLLQELTLTVRESPNSQQFGPSSENFT
jgi:hypothetical protein